MYWPPKPFRCTQDHAQRSKQDAAAARWFPHEESILRENSAGKIVDWGAIRSLIPYKSLQQLKARAKQLAIAGNANKRHILVQLAVRVCIASTCVFSCSSELDVAV
jgi:hypothetical protein